jgi:hypothetical protein
MSDSPFLPCIHCALPCPITDGKLPVAMQHGHPLPDDDDLSSLEAGYRLVVCPKAGEDPRPVCEWPTSQRVLAEIRQPTLEELRAAMPRKDGKHVGLYAAAPGSGPAGRTCKTCTHLRYMRAAKHPKCGLTKYTHGDATTIRTSTPACKLYEAAEG